MNKVEKIKAEIERLKNELSDNKERLSLGEIIAVNNCYNNLIFFIDSLEDTEKDFGIKEELVSENTQFAQMADKYEQQVLIGEYQMKESVAHHCRLSYYLGLKDGAQWQKEQLIDKACEWLNNFYSEDRHCYFVEEDIDNFKKAMEE
jgi:hypothetical protein